MVVRAPRPHRRSMHTTTTRSDEATRVALGVLGVALTGFGILGFVTNSPSTVSYLFGVTAVAVVLGAHLRRALPPALTLALAGLAVAHLAGGLLNVGDDVLYNAYLGTPVLQYDHLVHSSGVFIGTLVLWHLLMPRSDDPVARRDIVTVSVLAGLGLGAINETVEFLTTIANHGAHVGGYNNTGWDLVSNTLGALAAARWLTRSGKQVEL
ncbi:MAG: hypothetical protein QOD92_3875 [Acidimicrobiaceae bacterium]